MRFQRAQCSLCVGIVAGEFFVDFIRVAPIRSRLVVWKHSARFFELMKYFRDALMRVLAGIYPDYTGEIFFNGRPTRIHTPRLARELGIAMVHQELSLVPDLSVAENMFLGREAPSRIPGLINRRQVEKKAGAILAEIEVDISPTQRVNQLSVAKQQLVEIAKGISWIPKSSSWMSRPPRSPSRRSGIFSGSFVPLSRGASR